MLKEREADFWYEYDLEILRKCDGIILCPGWEASKGCKKEREWAKILGLEIRQLYKDKDLVLCL